MSEKLDEALTFAAKAHAGAVRKITRIPYILHPMEVAAVAASLTGDEDIIIACLLHDTVEDTPVTAEEVEQRFSPRVRALVASETEDKMNHLPRDASWKMRKENSLQVLKNATDPAVKILWLSDKLANMRSVYAGWLKTGDEVFNNFHMKDKAQHAWYYRTIRDCLAEFAETPAYMEYVRLCSLVFADIPETDSQI